MATTCINMHYTVLQKISKAAAHLETSRRDVIVHLLMRIMRDHDRLRGEFQTVKYQPDDVQENWHCFHIRYKPDEYEFFLDLRKVCKCSVSFLVAIAVERYLNKLLSKNATKKCVDNYILFKHYVLQRIIVEGVITWQIFWGFPKRFPET